MANDTEERLRAAFLRLKAGKPKIVAENTKLSPSAVEKEAGCGVSSLRYYSALFTEVQEEKKKRSKKSQLLRANNKGKTDDQKNRELREKISELQSELKEKDAEIKRLKKINMELFLRLESEVELKKLSESNYSI